eukprot:gb/GECG01005484.1/.p1 GENE.gb/GECG01005484.1/~~gb/GECG01005484.1/.p1  ORF type:complete len:224 (+),score=20.90 gb/GECG01005484.1/:1-672(+)
MERDYVATESRPALSTDSWDNNVIRRATQELEDIERQLSESRLTWKNSRAGTEAVNRDQLIDARTSELKALNEKMDSYNNYQVSRGGENQSYSGGNQFGYSRVWRTEDTTIGVDTNPSGDSNVNVNIRRSPPHDRMSQSSPIKHSDYGGTWNRSDANLNESRRSGARRESDAQLEALRDSGLGANMDLANLSGSGSLSAGIECSLRASSLALVRVCVFLCRTF